MTSNVTMLGQSVIYLAEKSLVTNVRWRSSMAMDYNFVKASIFLSASSSLLLLTPSYRVCLSQVMRMICLGEDDDDFPFSDTIYKTPSLYISGKVLYLPLCFHHCQVEICIFNIINFVRLGFIMDLIIKRGPGKAWRSRQRLPLTPNLIFDNFAEFDILQADSF